MPSLPNSHDLDGCPPPELKGRVAIEWQYDEKNRRYKVVATSAKRSMYFYVRRTILQMSLETPPWLLDKIEWLKQEVLE
jgi:hypothetical protein